MKILINPTDKIIEEHIDSADEVIVLHNLGNEAHFREYERRYIEMGYSIAYIHYYTDDKSYTMGVIKEWSIKPLIEKRCEKE